MALRAHGDAPRGFSLEDRLKVLGSKVVILGFSLILGRYGFGRSDPLQSPKFLFYVIPVHVESDELADEPVVRAEVRSSRSAPGSVKLLLSL